MLLSEIALLWRSCDYAIAEIKHADGIRFIIVL